MNDLTTKKKAIILGLALILLMPILLVLISYTSWSSTYICTNAKECELNENSIPGTGSLELYKEKRIIERKLLSHKIQTISLSSKLKTNPLTLGKNELYTTGGEAQHIQIGQDDLGYYIENISQSSTVIIEESGENLYIPELELNKEDELKITNILLRVAEMTTESIQIEITNGLEKTTYQIEKDQLINVQKGLIVSNATTEIENCINGFNLSGIKYQIKKFFNKDEKYIHLGGIRTCDKSIPLPGINRKEFLIEYRNGKYIFRPSTNNVKALSKYIVEIKSSTSPNLKSLKNTKYRPANHKKIRMKLGYTWYSLQFEKNANQSTTKLLFNNISKAKKVKGNEKNITSEPLTNEGYRGLVTTLVLFLFVFWVMGKIDLAANNNMDLSLPIMITVIFLFTLLTTIQLNWFTTSDWAIQCLLFIIALLVYGLRHYVIALNLFMYSVMLLLIIGIDFGQGLNFQLDSIRRFTDFSEQLKKITILLEVWFFLTYVPRLFVLIRDKAILLHDGATHSRFYSNLYDKYDIVKEFLMTIFSKITKILRLNKLLKWLLTTLFSSTWSKIFSLAFFIFLIQVFYGSETGIIGIQPMEITKISLCILFAAYIYPKLIFEEKIIRDSKTNNLWGWKESVSTFIYKPLVLFLSYLGMAYVVDEISYFIIVFFGILIWLLFYIAYPLLNYILNKKLRIQNSVIDLDQDSIVRYILSVIVMSLSIFLTWYFLYLIFEYKIFPFGGFEQRIDSWHQPDMFQQSAYQILQAYKLESLSEAWSKLSLVPEIDDDFALTGWRHSYSVLFKTIVIIPALVIYLFSLSWMYFKSRAIRLNATEEEKFYLEGFIAIGMGITIVHFILSISTNFNLLPVIGQPFPFIGRQGSFLSFFLLPFVIITTIVFQFKYLNKEQQGVRN